MCLCACGCGFYGVCLLVRRSVCVHVCFHACTLSTCPMQCGTPMENAHSANGGRPKYNLIQKTKQNNTKICVRNEAIVSLHLCLFVHVFLLLFFLFEGVRERMTFMAYVFLC